MKRFLDRKKHVIIGLGLIMSLGVFRCGSKHQESPIVAKVENRIITAEEFAFAYELSPRQLTSLENRMARLAVLDRLIDRILLTRNAEKLELGSKDIVLQRAIDIYRRQAINRELYLKHIRTPISVNEDEEREAFRRSKMTLFVKHFESELEEDAINVSKGRMPFEHIPVHPGVETITMDIYGSVDVIGWNDVKDDLEDQLYALPVHQCSEPIYDGRKYHVFQVVEHEREVLVRENDFLANRESIHGTLRKRKEVKAAAAFVDEIMASQELIIKADALNKLTDRIWNSRPASVDPRIQYIPNDEIKYIADNDQEIIKQPIAVYKDGTLTVSDIFFHYKVNPQKISYDSKLALRESLKNSVALYVRDWIFSEKGIREKLDRLPSVKEEVQTRSEYLLSKKMINTLYKDVAANLDTEEEFQVYLDTFVSELREKANIQVFDEQLMAVTTTDEGLSRKVDFIAVHTQ
ncbi:MAG: SurA N-terminal domain-containing protein [Candidatus Marinimicrobia bacterium]|nr:SurA N-terminal domain-containing protein [Candidatus Neomarinimicrobiota bacterium]